jgi:hypothetical protein
LINGKIIPCKISFFYFFPSNRYNEVRANAGIDCCIILVGNKLDQRHIRAVLSDDAKRYADERNIQ